MRAPLLLIDHGDISVFSSPEDLERYVESPDIDDYLVFDAVGCRVELRSAVGQARRVVDVSPVRLTDVSEAPQPDQLRNIIRGFLERLDVSTSADDDLSRLIDILVGAIGYTK